MYEEELKNRNIYFFKPTDFSRIGKVRDLDDLDWVCSRVTEMNKNRAGGNPIQWYMDINSSVHRHICFGNFSTFYLCLDSANLSSFKKYEIPMKFVSKIKRAINIEALLNER